MSIAELERPSQATTAVRHAVPTRHHSPRAARSQSCSPEPFDDLAIVLPARRLCGTPVAALGRRRHRGFEPCASSTAWLIGQGLHALDHEGRRRVMRAWSAVRDHGRPLVGDAGCDVRPGRAVVGPAERAALLAWLPLTHRELAVLEGGLFADAPGDAIALLVRPPTIWSLDEAVRVERLFPRERRFSPERFASIERHAYDHVRAEHLSRLHARVERIAAQLPVPELPVASETVTAGCALVVADDERCRRVAARQLARYASSSCVALAAG